MPRKGKRAQRSAQKRSIAASVSTRPRAVVRSMADSSIRRFTRTVQADQFSATNGADTFKAYKFMLSSLPDYTEFTALFDQYRIEEVELRLIPFAGGYAAGPYNYSVPDLLVVPDYDDASVPATKNAFYEREPLAITHGTQEQRIVLKPRVAQAAYSSGAFGGYSNVAAPWIDSSSASVEHYGVKVCLTAGSSANDLGGYTVYATYRVACRNTL